MPSSFKELMIDDFTKAVDKRQTQLLSIIAEGNTVFKEGIKEGNVGQSNEKLAQKITDVTTMVNKLAEERNILSILTEVFHVIETKPSGGKKSRRRKKTNRRR
jgi:hypothetical protein